MPTFEAHAKVNLFLHVLARESTGYHQIETLFCLLDLHDDLSIETGAPGLSLTVNGPDLGEARRNLVWRAAESFFVLTGIRENAHIILDKRIPSGAGLGGGSSDAAATLLALNTLHGSPLGPEALLDLGAALGSDVPFFVAGAAIALAWGRGERLIRLAAPEPAAALVVVPDQRIATATAYATLDSRRGQGTRSPVPCIIDPGALRSWSDIENHVVNDFAEAAIHAVPAIRDILDACIIARARIASVTGSGSACFAIFDDDLTRDSALDELAARFHDAAVISTRCGVDPHLRLV
jgi:4-diphosphocytidyl-2-C-methyl-D-erythritol kinase